MSIPVSIDPMGTLGGGGLPRGWTELEYLESTGTQYIDTGVYGTEHHGAELKYQITTLGSSVARVFGYRQGGSSHGFAYFSQVGSTSFWFLGNNKSNEQVAPLDLDIHIGKWNVDGSEELIWDGSKKELTGNVTDAFTASVAACIFRVCDGATYRYSYARVYYCKIFNNGRVIRNFVPALDPTGHPCMYDLITHTPFYNAGTGEFLYA